MKNSNLTRYFFSKNNKTSKFKECSCCCLKVDFLNLVVFLHVLEVLDEVDEPLAPLLDVPVLLAEVFLELGKVRVKLGHVVGHGCQSQGNKSQDEQKLESHLLSNSKTGIKFEFHISAFYIIQVRISLSTFFKRDFVVEAILSVYPINFLNCPLTFILMSMYILLLLCSCSLRKFL
jgi:hypothetical protein